MIAFLTLSGKLFQSFSATKEKPGPQTHSYSEKLVPAVTSCYYSSGRDFAGVFYVRVAVCMYLSDKHGKGQLTGSYWSSVSDLMTVKKKVKLKWVPVEIQF